ncbi:MAG: Crp/Fnr family transcriptional regulator [Candidatus Zixiibacteriota bacterium]|nr:MAG: Crp/Fnr family transcriptional regulator [candidate division Zixibacteria bacterium]
MPFPVQLIYYYSMDALELLHSCYLCRDLDQTELEALEKISNIRKLQKGEVLFLQGDPATGFYVLLSGSIRVYKASPDGREYTLHHIRAGQMFAEAAVFGGSVFPANAVASEASTVAFLPKAEFTRLIQASPQTSLKMIAALAGFVREFNQQIEDLSLKEVPARLAGYLLRAVKDTGASTFTLDISKSELARSLGTTSETLSRNLTKLRELGVISGDGREITVLDRATLEKIANGQKI